MAGRLFRRNMVGRWRRLRGRQCVGCRVSRVGGIRYEVVAGGGWGRGRRFGIDVNGRLLGRRPVAVYHMVGGLIGHNRITVCVGAVARIVRRALLGGGKEAGDARGHVHHANGCAAWQARMQSESVNVKSQMYNSMGSIPIVRSPRPPKWCCLLSGANVGSWKLRVAAAHSVTWEGGAAPRKMRFSGTTLNASACETIAPSWCELALGQG